MIESKYLNLKLLAVHDFQHRELTAVMTPSSKDSIIRGACRENRLQHASKLDFRHVP